MKAKHQVHNLIILDESGSMESIRKTVIEGFNELVQSIKGAEKQFPDQEHFISFVTFNSFGNKLLHFIDPVSSLKPLDDRKYRPDAMTPLLDAMGFSLNKLKQYLENRNDYHVLVTILTDGEENASKEFSGSAIKKMVEELKPKQWTFTYIGTDHDVEKIAFSLSINNTMSFNKNPADMKDMFQKERDSRHVYFQKVSRNESTQEDYFDTKNQN